MTEADAPPRWGIPDAALALVAATVCSVLVGASWIAVSGTDEATFGLAMASVVGLWGGFVGVPVLASRRKGTGRLSDDFGARMEPGDIGVGAVAGLASQLLLVPALYLALRALFPDTFADPGENAEELFDRARGVGTVAMVLVLVVGAPVVEELFFRGLLQRSLVRRLGPPVGIAVGALVFGLTHYDVAAFPGLVAFGAVLGVLAHRSGRLGASVVAHVAFNAVTVGVLLAGR